MFDLYRLSKQLQVIKIKFLIPDKEFMACKGHKYCIGFLKSLLMSRCSYNH